MPALSAPQLALLRSQYQTSNWYCVPVPPVTVFAAQINAPTITIGAVVIPYDNVTSGAFANVLKGMSVWIGTAPGLNNVAWLRERLDADASNIYVAWNSDVAWADDYYITVVQQFLPWGVSQRMVGEVIYKDYNIAYTNQTVQYPPVAVMGDNECKLFAGNPTPVSFDGSASYAVAPGATITGYAWAFGDGGTSTSATPGNHNYTAAGTYYATLTVTDSNGKTHLTRRIICLPDPATVYTVSFEGTKLDAQIDNGWSATVRVFDPNADESHFPSRAPCFLISTDSYAGTVGSVGFPTGRTEVLFFGYIVEDSVAVQPEYNEVSFDIESIAGVAGRVEAQPVLLNDTNDPTLKVDAWQWGVNVTVWRALVYLFKNMSTVMDIADVLLYNDATKLRSASFPADNLWNEFLQFAQSTHMHHVGVTRTGRVVMGQDPNLIPVASRGSIVTVCQFVQGDWREQVTIPQRPFSATSYACLIGYTYDGVPPHEANVVLGMSPGRPPKSYGVEKTINYLACVDQVDVNTLAGLVVGRDNSAFGDVVIPLRGNWVKAFDPALQEYVQTPSGGWVTKRGALLDSVKIIVRKLTVESKWPEGVMQPTLTCEAYTYPEISTNGDCYSPDAPPPPSVPPIVIVPQPPPNPTGAGTTPFGPGIFTLFDNDDIYRVTSLSSGGGSATELPKWKNTQHAGNYTARDHAPAISPVQNMIVENNNTSPETLALARTTNDGVTSWTVANTDMTGGIVAAYIDSDHTNRNLLFAAGCGTISKLAIAATVAGTGEYLPSGAPVDFFANTGEVSLWYSTDGGANWTKVLLDYLGQLLPSRVMGNNNAGTGSTLLWQEVSNPGFPFDFCTNFDAGRWIDTTTSPWTNRDYKVCNASAFHSLLNVNVYDPSTGQFMLMLANNNTLAYVCAPEVYISQTHVSSAVPGTVDETAVTPAQIFNGMQIPVSSLTRTGTNFIWSVTKTGTKTSKQLAVSDYSIDPFDVFQYGACDPTSTDDLYFVTLNGELVVVAFSTLASNLFTIGGTGVPKGLIVTTQGTLLIGLDNGHIRRSTNGGSSFTDIDVSALFATLATFHVTEYGGVVSGSAGTLVLAHTSGAYIYSVDDGLTWLKSSVIATNGAGNTVLSNKARG